MNNEYKLTIVFGDEQGTTNTETKVKNQQEKTTRAIGNVAKAQVIKPFINTVSDIYFNNLQTSTGSSQLMERQKLVVSLAQQGINAYQSIQGGIAFGSAIGLGVLGGGILGGALFALNTAFNLISAQNEINNKKKIEDVEIEYQRTRMGIANNKSRTGA